MNSVFKIVLKIIYSSALLAFLKIIPIFKLRKLAQGGRISCLFHFLEKKITTA